MQLLKIIRNADPDELERETNNFVEHSGLVHYVVHMRVYPPNDLRAEWCCYVVYKKKFTDGQKTA